MTTVNYFDLGLHNGFEVEKFLADSDGIPDIEVRVHGIEADPRFARACEKRFSSDGRVNIHNFAVGFSDGEIDLHLEKTGLGSSVYADKPNVAGGGVARVPQRRLSAWLAESGFVPKRADAINVIKANIEGAEWDLIRDLDQSGLFGLFDMFCGPQHNQDWTHDMHKVPSLRPHVAEAKSILARHGVYVHKYVVHHRGVPGGPVAANVIDMRESLNDMLCRRGGR